MDSRRRISVRSSESSSSSLFKYETTKMKFIMDCHKQLSSNLDNLGKAPRLGDIFDKIANRYFYEKLANISFSTRLEHFFKNVRIGDRFIAKILKVFERSAMVELVWSNQQEMSDLKVNATLKLFNRKLINEYRRNYNYSENDESLNKTLEISERLSVEVSFYTQKNRQIEVIQCLPLSGCDNKEAEDIDRHDYQSVSPGVITFCDYMLKHDDLNNPAIVKTPIFTSLLHHKLITTSLKKIKAKSNRPNGDHKNHDNNDRKLNEHSEKVHRKTHRRKTSRGRNAQIFQVEKDRTRKRRLSSSSESSTLRVTSSSKRRYTASTHLKPFKTHKKHKKHKSKHSKNSK